MPCSRCGASAEVEYSEPITRTFSMNSATTTTVEQIRDGEKKFIPICESCAAIDIETDLFLIEQVRQVYKHTGEGVTIVDFDVPEPLNWKCTNCGADANTLVVARSPQSWSFWCRNCKIGSKPVVLVSDTKTGAVVRVLGQIGYVLE